MTENGGTATITVTRTGGSEGAVSVAFATSNGTATAGADYTTRTGTLNFAPGVTTQTFTIPILDDTVSEAEETVNLTLSNPTGGATLGAPSTAVLTLTDDDAPPSLSVNDVTVTEGDGGLVNAVFTVTLSAASGLPVMVQFATADGTAMAPADYQGATGTLTFAPGQTSRTVTVLVNGDALDEADETFFVNLSNPANATIADGQGVGTITDDDQPPPDQDPVFNNPNQQLVAQLFRDLLGRRVDPAGLALYAGLLDRGISPEVVVRGLEASPEFRARQVQNAFRTMLGRAADRVGLDVHVRFLEQGGSMDVVNTCVLVSEEYFQTRGGGTNAGWLRAVYRDVLGREIDPSGEASFGALLARGASREQVAAAVLTSTEGRQRLVDGLYRQFLRRPADASGLNAFVGLLQRGAREELVIAALLTSAEYRGRR